jgi:antitoxin component YwqK of YwqJK toxin-antitoxin module
VIDGRREGTGKSYVNDLLVYTGDFHNDSINGHGIAFDSNGKRTYEGNWVNGVIAGRGNSYNADGKINYIGNWSNNQKDGIGTTYNHTKETTIITDPTTHVSTITLKDKILLSNSIYDKGKLIKTNHNQIYIGTLDEDGLPDGTGIIDNLYDNSYTFDTDYYYKGQFTHGMMIGNGQLLNAGQAILYDGAVLNGVREGNGAQYESGYIRYVGSFSGNKRNGFGALLYSNGDIQVQGNFINDVLQP